PPRPAPPPPPPVRPPGAPQRPPATRSAAAATDEQLAPPTPPPPPPPTPTPPRAARPPPPGNTVRFPPRGKLEPASPTPATINELVDRLGRIPASLRAFARRSDDAGQASLAKAVDAALLILHGRLEQDPPTLHRHFDDVR
ncbi:hypothetical protein QMO42_30065, partial [Pseudomonas aeruginosa]|nr:hypothetical protein [Pseudomonas aeruginosa]